MVFIVRICILLFSVSLVTPPSTVNVLEFGNNGNIPVIFSPLTYAVLFCAISLAVAVASEVSIPVPDSNVPVTPNISIPDLIFSAFMFSSISEVTAETSTEVKPL